MLYIMLYIKYDLKIIVHNKKMFKINSRMILYRNSVTRLPLKSASFLNTLVANYGDYTIQKIKLFTDIKRYKLIFCKKVFFSSYFMVLNTLNWFILQNYIQ